MNKKKLLFLSAALLGASSSQCWFKALFQTNVIKKFETPLTDLHLLPDGRVINYSTYGAAIVAPDGKVVSLEPSEGYSIQKVYNMPNGNFATVETEIGIEKFSDQRSVVRIWSPDGEWIKALSDHTDGITSVAFLQNGNIATGSSDNTVKIWDAETEECVRTITSKIPNAMVSVTALPDGTIATGSRMSATQVWNPETGRLVRKIDLGGLTGRISLLKTLPDGNWMCCIDSPVFKNKQIKIINPVNGRCLKTFNITVDHNYISADPIEGKVSLTPPPEFEAEMLSNGNIAYWYGDCKTVYVLDYETGKVVHELAGHTEEVLSVTPLTDGNLLTHSWDDDTTRMWNEAGECVHVFEGGLADPYVSSICTSKMAPEESSIFLPTGELVTLSKDQKAIRVYNLETRECVDTLKADKEFTHVIIRQDGTLATVERNLSDYSSSKGFLKFWKVKTETKVKAKLETKQGVKAESKIEAEPEAEKH